MTKYRLNKAEKVQVTINNIAKTRIINGKPIVTYSNYIRLTPGVIYETDDEAMLNFFRQYKRKVRWTPQIEEALKSADVPYELEWCKVCSGKVKKISYRVVEVMDNE